MTEPNTSAGEKVDLIASTEELMAKQLKRSASSSENSLSGNAAMLIAAAYALQVARGDEDIIPPQIGAELKERSIRATGIGILRS